MPPFRSIKLRKRRTTCPACGTEAQRIGKIEDIDYVQFCAGARPDWVTLGQKPGNSEWRITANVGLSADKLCILKQRVDGLPRDTQELRDIIKSKSVRILDVRPKTEFGICHLPSSIRMGISPSPAALGGVYLVMSIDRCPAPRYCRQSSGLCVTRVRNIRSLPSRERLPDCSGSPERRAARPRFRYQGSGWWTVRMVARRRP
jgi:hypothetical protein